MFKLHTGKQEDIIYTRLKKKNSHQGKKENSICVKCGKGKMILKSGRYGAFLSCSNFPACKNSVSFFSNTCKARTFYIR